VTTAAAATPANSYIQRGGREGEADKGWGGGGRRGGGRKEVGGGKGQERGRNHGREQERMGEEGG